MALSSAQHHMRSTPPPKDSTSPSLQTPKRKRSNAIESNGGSLRLNTEVQSQQDYSCDAILNSPRTKVTEKLKDLNLHQMQPVALRADKRPVARKRLRRNTEFVDNSFSGEISGLAPREKSTDLANDNAYVIIDEVGETPDCRVRTQAPPAESPGSLQMLGEVYISPPKPRDGHEFDPQLSLSPPRMLMTSPVDSNEIIDRSVSPLPLRKELSPDQAALTWQDEEITGHELDPSGDDDGEGINGIGFQPTPAMAYARQQRRKQQVNEWKAREAREARQKRIERRRGATEALSRADGVADAASKRMVRFAGVG